MTTGTIPKIEMRHAMSVWNVCGSPLSNDGLIGSHRSLLFLLAITAEVPDARDAFISECSKQDEIEYTKARVDHAHYFGWVRVPKEDTPWALPGMLDFERLTKEFTVENQPDGPQKPSEAKL